LNVDSKQAEPDAELSIRIRCVTVVDPDMPSIRVEIIFRYLTTIPAYGKLFQTTGSL